MTTEAYDIAILSATPGGIAAAIAAARLGRRVVLLERSRHIGGLPANGLGVTDIVTREATGGVFKEFIAAVLEHYTRTYGGDSQQLRDCNDGYRFEPHVAELVLEAMLAEQPNITVRRRRQFDAEAANVTLAGEQLAAMRVTNLDSGAAEQYQAEVFIDASYEGDLAAAAGCPYRVGRESADAHGEPCAGRVYYDWLTGEILPGSTGQADRAVQAYNYRICMTQRDDMRVPFARPADYHREDYLSIPVDVRAGRLLHGIYRYPRAATAKPVPIPNGKYDANDHPKSLISTDLAEENWQYPEADWAWRDRFAQRLRDYELGMFWFCGHDESLSEEFRHDTLRWGLCKDEYADNGHFPRQLYVREGRRIEGEYLFTALDCINAADLAGWRDILAGRAEPDENMRPRLHADSITAGHYPIDSHPCHKPAPGDTAREGYFALAAITRPYTVPYGVIVPKRVDGLLTPVPVSATHVGFGTLRMEPCWMALGQAAGVAAHLAIESRQPPRRVDVGRLQRYLLGQRAVLVYFRDLAVDHENFAAVQWFGVRGFFQGYQARPDEPITEAQADEWRRQASFPGEIEYARGTTTAAQYLQKLFELSVKESPR